MAIGVWGNITSFAQVANSATVVVMPIPFGSADQGSIQDRMGVDCSPTRRQRKASSPRLQGIARRKMSDSLPTRPTAVAAIARFCGLIILPTTPPEVLAATSSVSSMPMLLAAVCCSVANSALAEVSEPVTAVPIQPRIGDRKANAAPAPAIQVPMVMVRPEAFMT